MWCAVCAVFALTKPSAAPKYRRNVQTTENIYKIDKRRTPHMRSLTHRSSYIHTHRTHAHGNAVSILILKYVALVNIE